MRRYSGSGSAAAGTNLTIAEILAVGTTTRARIYDIIVGSDATPADIADKFRIIRGTVSGTGTTTFVPTALDPADPASLMSCKLGTFSGQTKTANSQLLEIALNQRATFRWVAVPDSELIIPATADNWVGLESIASGGTPNINCCFLWQE
jgi:hypothetical protein